MRVSPITLVSFPVTCSALIGSLKLTGNELAKNVYQNVKDVSTFQRKCEKITFFEVEFFVKVVKGRFQWQIKLFRHLQRDPGVTLGPIKARRREKVRAPVDTNTRGRYLFLFTAI